MPVRAWIYISGVLVAALCLTASAVATTWQQPTDTVALLVLAALATAAHLNKAEGPTHISFYATPLFIFAALLLLPPLAFMLVVVIPHLCEWILALRRGGAHLRHWYIQPFNIAMHLIAGLSAAMLHTALQPYSVQLASSAALWSAALAALAYYVLSESQLALALVLARNVAWRDLGLLSVDKVLPETIMLCLGLTLAVTWQINPWLVIPVVLPLLLMYRTLTIPLLKQEAQTDGKTGLLNARHFAREFAAELERADRFNRPLAVIMADLDYLRTINNTYGHLAGDTVLRGIADIMRRTIRDYDLAGRFGGEEFCIVMPETELAEAAAIAERVREAIEAARFTVSTSPTPIGATMSFGVAAFPNDAMTTTGLTHEADVAVYQAKIQGRNRVVCAQEIPHSLKLETLAARETAPEAASATAASPAVIAPAHVAPVAAAVRDVPPAAQPAAQPLPAPASERLPGRPARADQQAGPPTARRAAWLFPAFVATIIALGLAAATLALVLLPWPAAAELLPLVVLMIMAEKLQVNVYGDNTFSVGAAVMLTAALVAGLPGVVVVSAANAIVHHLEQRRTSGRLYKAAFNWATHVLAGSVAAVLLGGGVETPTPTHLLILTLRAIVAALGYFTVDSLAISTVISLSRGSRLGATWRAQFEWLVGYYVVLGVLGVFLGIAYQALTYVGLVVFALPLLMMHYVQKQYVHKTEASVLELKRMNSELSGANQEVRDASRAIQQLNSELKAFNDELFETLGSLLDARDPYVLGHSAKVADYATLIARELRLPEEEVTRIRQAGYLHDIGKIAIPEQILHKPDMLTADEYERIKTHASIGGALLESSAGLRHLAPFVRHHHERWDGQGYPDRLAGEGIPLAARIINVCDAVEAMASDRPYHKAMSTEAIVAEVQRCAGAQFDPTIAAAFVRVVEREGQALVVNSASEVARQRALKTQLQLPYAMQWSFTAG